MSVSHKSTQDEEKQSFCVPSELWPRTAFPILTTHASLLDGQQWYWTFNPLEETRASIGQFQNASSPGCTMREQGKGFSQENTEHGKERHLEAGRLAMAFFGSFQQKFLSQRSALERAFCFPRTWQFPLSWVFVCSCGNPEWWHHLRQWFPNYLNIGSCVFRVCDLLPSFLWPSWSSDLHWRLPLVII